MKAISRSGFTASCSLKLGSTQAGGHLHTLATLSFGKEPRVITWKSPRAVLEASEAIYIYIYIYFTAASKQLQFLTCPTHNTVTIKKMQPHLHAMSN
jgi:hypothetical protein